MIEPRRREGGACPAAARRSRREGGHVLRSATRREREGGARPSVAHRRRREGGIALILSLLLLTLLIVLISQMSATSLHNRTTSENHISDLQNAYGTRSGYHLALLYLQTDAEKGSSTDSAQDKWFPPLSLQLGRAQVRVDIHDSERFINLSLLVGDKGEPNAPMIAQLRRLAALLEHPPEMAERIIDYVDGDTRGSFEARARNERLSNIDELLRIEGLTPEFLYGGEVQGRKKVGILPFLTVWPKPGMEGGAAPSGKVNVNTAPVEVLWSLSDEMTQQAAEAIVEYRQQSGGDGLPRIFGSVEDVRKIGGLSERMFTSIADRLTVKAETFEIKAKSQAGTVEKAWVYVVRRVGGSKGEHKLVASQRINDFMSVRPAPKDE